MRSVEPTDLTAKAQIREAALRLFAEDGFDRVSVRRIAGTAGVSPGLVLHHFGSKQGLREAVDEHVIGQLDRLAGSVDEQALVDSLQTTSGEDPTLESFARQFPAGSPVWPYLRRMLLADDEAARRLVRHWYATASDTLTEWSENGLLDPGPDPAVRAALLLSADLGLLLLRDALAEVLGFDPLHPEGVRRWAADATALGALMLTDQARRATEETP